MKIKLTIIIFVGLLIALTAFIFNMTKPTYVSMDGVKYEVEIYKVPANYFFYQFKNEDVELEKWRHNNVVLGVAMYSGASFTRGLTDLEMEKLCDDPLLKTDENTNTYLTFRSRAEKFKKIAQDPSKGFPLDTIIKITKAVVAKSKSEKLLIVEDESSGIGVDPIRSTMIFISINDSWKFVSNKRHPEETFEKSMDRVSGEAYKMLESGKIKLSNGKLF